MMKEKRNIIKNVMFSFFNWLPCLSFCLSHSIIFSMPQEILENWNRSKVFELICHRRLFCFNESFSLSPFNFILKEGQLCFICYIENFVCGKFRMKRHQSSNFVFIFSQSNRNKNLLTRDSALQTVFSTMLLYCFFKSAHVLPAQKEISFFSRYAVLSKNNQIRNSCDTFQRNQTPGFPMLIFPTKNKYYFHYYFHGIIFLRFKKI